jgi:hypothetical protein
MTDRSPQLSHRIYRNPSSVRETRRPVLPKQLAHTKSRRDCSDIAQCSPRQGGNRADRPRPRAQRTGLPGRGIGRSAMLRLARQPRGATVAHDSHMAAGRAADIQKLASGHNEVSRPPDAMATDKVVEVRHGSLRRVGIRTIYTLALTATSTAITGWSRRTGPSPPSQDGNCAFTALIQDARIA